MGGRYLRSWLHTVYYRLAVRLKERLQFRRRNGLPLMDAVRDDIATATRPAESENTTRERRFKRRV